MEFLKNIVINLKATGPAAVFIAWIIGVTLRGLFGEGDVARIGLSVLSVGGALLVTALSKR
jgi:hypothetical protein